MSTILGEICKMTFIRQVGVLKRIGYGSSDSKMFNGNIVATSYAYLIKIGQVTPEITLQLHLFGRSRDVTMVIN